MEELPMALALQPDESQVRRWSLWGVGVFLTEKRLVIYSNARNCTVARLDHVSSVQSATTVNGGQQGAGFALFAVGLAAGLMGLYQMLSSPYGYGGVGTIFLAGGLTAAVVGLLIALTARRTELYVTLCSSEKVRLAPKGYADTKQLEAVMKDLGDALACADTEKVLQAE